MIPIDTLNTLLSVPAVVAIVTLAKSFGLSGKWSLLAAVVVAVALQLAAYQWSAEGWFSAVATGLLLGLSAAGLYDVAKVAAPKE